MEQSGREIDTEELRRRLQDFTAADSFGEIPNSRNADSRIEGLKIAGVRPDEWKDAKR
jgi:hypothetical protein